MSKKCTPLWREAHFEVKMYKHTSVGPLLEVEMSKKCTPLWREAHFEVKMHKHTTCSRHFWRFRCRFAWQAQGIVHLVKSEENVRVLYHFQPQPPLHYTTLQYITLHYNYNYTFTTFYYTPRTPTLSTLHYVVTLHHTTLHLHYSLHYIQLQLHNHSTTLHRYTKLHYTTLHYTTRHSTTLHDTPLHSTTDVVLRGRCKGFVHLVKSEQNVRVL